MDYRDDFDELDQENSLYYFYYSLPLHKRGLFKRRAILECGWTPYQWDNRYYKKNQMSKAETSLVERIYYEVKEIGY